jgi:hypothetical protein
LRSKRSRNASAPDPFDFGASRLRSGRTDFSNWTTTNNGVLAILDESDHVVRLKHLPNDLPTVLSELAPYRDQLAGGAVVSTFN